MNDHDKVKDLLQKVEFSVLNVYDRGYANGIDDYVKELDMEGLLQKAREEGYSNGLNDAWIFAREIGEWTPSGIQDVFGEMFTTQYSVLRNINYNEANRKLKKWEDDHREEEIPNTVFHVGDEVCTAAGDLGIVTSIDRGLDGDGLDRLTVINKHGKPYAYLNSPHWKKTGNNYPGIADIFKGEVKND